MRIVIWFLVGLVAVVGVVAVVGYLLPVNHEASRTVELPKPPADVFAVIADFRNVPAWWGDMKHVEVISGDPGHEKFRQTTSTGPLVMKVVEHVSPSKYVTKIDDPSQPFGGTWTWEITPVGEGKSRLTLTERGEVYNPIFRALARFVFGYTRTIDSYLAALAKHVIEES